MIEALQLTKSYATAHALDSVSFRVATGEIVGLIGKNGAGKSTTLKLLSGQLLPSSGDVLVDGYSVARDPLAVRRLIGYQPDVPPLYPEMSPRAFLDFTARLRGLNRKQARERVSIVMTRTGLEPVANQAMRGLSHGFQQRVGIAQALVHNPKVVLLDEPTSGLDPFQIAQMRDLIRSLRPDHTVLFSSHLLPEVTRVCDRILLIDQGRVKAQGTEAELRAQSTRRPTLMLTVRGDRAGLAKALERFPQLAVSWMDAPPPGTVRARLSLLTEGTDLREEISHALDSAGLGLLELRSDMQRLEDIFMFFLGPNASGARPATRGGL
jgi:ABC-2 type transport system ATP-binding protein